MCFDWKNYLILARSLQGQNEAASRSAVSRAYYAAYCHARNQARDRQNFKPAYDSSDHTKIRSHFRSQGMLEIAIKLDRLRQWRNKCDYEDTVSNISSMITSAISFAQKVVDKLP